MLNGHNDSEETTYVKQGAGLHIEMITVNGWYGGEGWKKGGGSGCLFNW